MCNLCAIQNDLYVDVLDWSNLKQIQIGIGLKELFKKYGGICVESGILCRNYFKKLINLDKKCREFYDLCKQKLNYIAVYTGGKRVASSPAYKQYKRSDRKDT